MYSIYDLVYNFIAERPGAKEISDTEKKYIMYDIKELLEKGWTEEEIVDAIKKLIPITIPSWDVNLSSLSAHRRPKERNLLKPDTFYWHPQLRILPRAPQRFLDYNTGEIKKVDEEYFLEMRASYTIKELADYYFKQMMIDSPTAQDYKRISGALNHLCANHSIDTVLFMIDMAANHVIEGDARPIDTPLKIVDYLREAREAMGQKMTEEIQAGGDKIVPRRRVPLGRGRS